MSLLTVLKTIGKDLSHFAGWVEDAVKIAAPVVASVDPQLAPIVGAVESILDDVQKASSAPLSAATVQAITSAITTLQMVAPTALNPTIVAKIEAGVAALPAVGAAVTAATVPKTS